MFFRSFHLAALCLIITLNGVLAECPNINDLPVLNDELNEFYCMWIWYDFGSTELIDGCNGFEWYGIDKYDYPGKERTYIPFGSVIVKAGCTVYGYGVSILILWQEKSRI